MIAQLLTKLVEPKSKNEDVARRERILNILLLGAIVLSTSAVLVVLVDIGEQGPAYPGVPIQILASVALSFLALYFFSHAGKSRLVAYVFIWLYFIPAVYTSYNWGAGVPQALLIYVLVIVMAGVLIGTKFALIMTAFTSITLFIIAYLQAEGIILANTAWINRPLHSRDVSVFVATLAIIAIVSWLFNREIEKALHRARGSEKALKKERDLLEIKVEERTKQLKKAQMEKIQHLYRFAEFGQMTAGLFHDIANPLTLVSLNLEKLGVKDESSLVKQAIKGTERIRRFVKAIRRQIQQQEIKINFVLDEEIAQVIEVFNHKAKDMAVKICLESANNIRMYGNPIKFNQVVTNLLSNAIDAYEKIGRRNKREVVIKLNAKDGEAVLIVQDFGVGIPKKNIKKVFEPFFTTKNADISVGIGLPISKNIIEKDFGGKIKAKSKEGAGTTFTVKFPIK